jgi:hypothetical protein
MGIINTSPEQLAVDLRTYGEEALAQRVPRLTEAELSRIGELAFVRATDPRSGGLLAKALALAAVEVMEGEPRPLTWSRRKLKGIYPGV